ncbi:MAG: hypothetical protein V3V18_07005 [Methylococcales bacterium]
MKRIANYQLILIAIAIVVGLYGCTTKNNPPPSQFIAPTFNLEAISKPPSYPNNKLSDKAVKIPSDVSIKDGVIWYEEDSIAFIGGDIYIYKLGSKKFHKLEKSGLINEKINRYLNNTRIEWIEDTSTLMRAWDITLFTLKMSAIVLNTLASPGTANLRDTEMSVHESYYGYCKNLSGTSKLKIEKTVYKLSASYFINGKEIEGASLDSGVMNLMPGGRYINSGSNFIEIETGKVVNSVVLSQEESIPPVIVGAYFNPAFSQVLLLYQDNNSYNVYSDSDNYKNKPTYSIEIVDYNLPELK